MTGAIPGQDSSGHFITKRACNKRGAKHTAAIGGTTAAYADNDAGYSDTICCCTTADPPRILRPWILQRAEKNADEEDVVLNVKEIGEVAVEARVPVI